MGTRNLVDAGSVALGTPAVHGVHCSLRRCPGDKSRNHTYPFQIYDYSSIRSPKLALQLELLAQSGADRPSRNRSVGQVFKRAGAVIPVRCSHLSHLSASKPKECRAPGATLPSLSQFHPAARAPETFRKLSRHGQPFHTAGAAINAELRKSLHCLADLGHAPGRCAARLAIGTTGGCLLPTGSGDGKHTRDDTPCD